jgi:hypothetical protein
MPKRKAWISFFELGSILPVPQQPGKACFIAGAVAVLLIAAGILFDALYWVSRALFFAAGAAAAMAVSFYSQI